jgi:hypothetical protein
MPCVFARVCTAHFDKGKKGRKKRGKMRKSFRRIITFQFGDFLFCRQDERKRKISVDDYIEIVISI